MQALQIQLAAAADAEVRVTGERDGLAERVAALEMEAAAAAAEAAAGRVVPGAVSVAGGGDEDDGSLVVVGVEVRVCVCV